MINKEDKLAGALWLAAGERDQNGQRWPILMSDDPIHFADHKVIAKWLRSEEGIAVLAADDVIREGIAQTERRT